MNYNNKHIINSINIIIVILLILLLILILNKLYKKNQISHFENNQVDNQKFHFITYGDDKVNCKSRIIQEAENFKVFDSINFFEPKDISKEFYNKHKNVLEQKRGGGYWIWKYDIILQKLNEINNNDILVYTDCGCTINAKGINKFYEYVKMLNDSHYSIISFEIKNHIEREYTTKELFNNLNIDLESDIAKSEQYTAAILIMKKTDHLMLILNKCMELLNQDNNLITDLYNNTQESYFKDNRHDQSILSLIRKKYKSIVINDYNDDIKEINESNKHIPFMTSRKR